MAIPRPGPGAKRVSRPGESTAPAQDPIEQQAGPVSFMPQTPEDYMAIFAGGGAGGGGSTYDPSRLMAAQQDAAAKVRQAQIAAQLAGLQGGLAQQQADIPTQLAELEASRQFGETAMQRRGILSRAALDNTMAGRGLAQSGVRLGARGRSEADLLEKLGALNLTAQQQGNQIQRQGASQQGDILAQIAALQAEQGAL